MPLTVVDHPRGSISLPPSREAIVSWRTLAERGTISLRVSRNDGRVSSFLGYATFAEDGRESLDGRDDLARIDTDVVRSSVDIVAIEVASDVPIEMVAVATRPQSGTATEWSDGAAVMLPVGPLSQYPADHPHERGWCSPASLAMLMNACGEVVDVSLTAESIYDRRYGGTGNWAFATALANARGLFSTVLYLRDLRDAERFLAEGIPLAASIAWNEGSLPGAALARSDGHLVVLRGCDATAAVVNDPAHPQLVVRYERAAFERCWLGHGGVAYVAVPPQLRADIVALANR